MKILNLLVFLTFTILYSCSNNQNDPDMKKYLSEKHKLDEIWKIEKLKVLSEVGVSFLPELSDCKEAYVQYEIILQQNCYENKGTKSTLENNLIVKEIKKIFSFDSLKRKIYEKNECLSKDWINQVIEKERIALQQKVGSTICLERKSLLNRECIRHGVYSNKDYSNEMFKLRENTEKELQGMTLHKKGESFFKKDRVIYCQSEEGVIFP